MSETKNPVAVSIGGVTRPEFAARRPVTAPMVLLVGPEPGDPPAHMIDLAERVRSVTGRDERWLNDHPEETAAAELAVLRAVAVTDVGARVLVDPEVIERHLNVLRRLAVSLPAPWSNDPDEEE